MLFKVGQFLLFLHMGIKTVHITEMELYRCDAGEPQSGWPVNNIQMCAASWFNTTDVKSAKSNQNTPVWKAFILTISCLTFIYLTLVFQ